MKAKKLPSGSWRLQVFLGTDADGKRIRKSFTAHTKKECEMLAAEFMLTYKKQRSKDYLSLSDAWDKYIELRSNVLSPSTVREYKAAKKNSFLDIMEMNIYEITQEDVQSEINKMSNTVSPKTVRNKHGLLSAVLKQYRPNFALNTKLPQKIKPTLYVPSDMDVKRVIDSTNDDNDMLIAILLAAFGPMRRSEICGLYSTDLNGKTIHVQRAVVLNDNHEWIEKTTKSVAGNRFIPLPDFVYDKIKDRKGKIVDLNPNNITDRFEWILKRADVPHFRFHDLRHYGASIQHAMGIPDAYIMQRGGWGNDAVLKNVYRHAMEQKEKEENEKINSYFEATFNS